MMKFKSMQSRLTMIFIGISLLTMLILGGCSIYGAVQEKNRLMSEFRKDMEKGAELQLEWQTHSAWSVVEHCYQAQVRGELTQEQAMQRAADFVRNMRYDNEQGYFTIDTDEGVNVVLLGTAAEGKPRLDAQDPEGRYFVREISKVVPDEILAPVLAEVPGVAHRSQCTLSSLWMLSKALISWSEQAAA